MSEQQQPAVSDENKFLTEDVPWLIERVGELERTMEARVRTAYFAGWFDAVERRGTDEQFSSEEVGRVFDEWKARGK